MRAIAGLGILAGTAVTALVVRRIRTDSLRDCSCKELRRLIDELPHRASIDDRLAAIERAFVTTFGMPLAILLSRGDTACVQHRTTGFVLNDEDLADAASAIQSGSLVRRDRRHGSRYSFPLLTATTCVGALFFEIGSRKANPDWPLLRSFANQTALALLRSDLENQARHIQVLADADRFQKALLDSVAHNVRTPLASIIGALSALQEEDAVLNRTAQRELLDTARQEANRLNRLLGNLLDLSRLESGSVDVRAGLCDVQDVIGAALEQLGAAKDGRRVDVVIQADLPPVPMDFVLIAQVIVNLLDNAAKYSPQDSPILIEARAVPDSVLISVSDEGDGIAEEDQVRVFEKFNRAGRSSETGGIGLGLPICRGLVEAHRGAIRIEPRSPRGTKVTFSLPLQTVDQEAVPA